MRRQQYDRGGSGSRGGGGSGRRGGGGGGRGSGRRSNGPDTSRMPLEQGRIASLLDNFGFIYCADRPIELFFHYSSFRGRSDDLEVGDEVEFRVGPSGRDPDKLAAYELRLLEPGTIRWQTEDKPGERTRGKIERPARVGGNRAGDRGTEGTIRVLLDDKDEEEPNGDDDKEKRGPLIRYQPNEYQPDPDSKNGGTSTYSRQDSRRPSHGLCRNDLVSFALLTDRRTKLKFAKDITLELSEKERLEMEREKKLLETATEERGVVVGLRQQFGFIRSNKRREDVYFHFSHIELPDADGGDDEEGAEADFTLAVGQPLSFLVVDESKAEDEGGNVAAGSRPRGGKISARQVKFLPQGTVIKFQHVLAQGVTGKVIQRPCPKVPPNSIGGIKGGRQGSNKLGPTSLTDGTPGKIMLDEPITSIEAKALLGTDTITEVDIPPLLSPGGSFCTNRDGSRLACWVHEGDTLLFDVVVDCVDGWCRVEPTASLIPGDKVEGSADETTNSDVKPAVRLVACSLAGRAEGIVHLVKELDGHGEGYGFIHLAERNADAYFRLYDVVPRTVNGDLVRNLTKDKTSGEKIPTLEAGAEVMFDMYLQDDGGQQNSHMRRGRNQERDNIKALRLTLLPPGTIMQKKVLASGVRGKVTKSNHPYAGTIELEEPVTKMSAEERHPLAAKLLDSLEADPREDAEVVFHHPESVQDNKIFKSMVADRQGRLVLEEVPFTGTTGGEAQQCLRIAKAKKEDAAANISVDSTAEETDIADAAEADTDAADGADGADSADAEQGKRVKKNKKKTATSVSYNKQGISADQVKDPPRLNDLVTCDVVQTRRSGAIVATNVKVAERSSRPAAQVDTLAQACLGYILMEPSHTSLANTPSRKPVHGNADKASAVGSRWSNVDLDGRVNKKGGSETVDQGRILLLEDPGGLFKQEESEKDEDGAAVGSHLSYTTLARGAAPSADNPRRGDLVAFTKGRIGERSVRDIRVMKHNAVTVVKGCLQEISKEANTATFVSSTNEEYTLNLYEIVSCAPSLVKDGEVVEGILHNGKIHGVCRAKDLYLSSKVSSGSGLKQRPKLNLTVKKELKGLGGQIIAQSGMAKGPDNTMGFVMGWTKRTSSRSKFREEEEKEAKLAAEAAAAVAAAEQEKEEEVEPEPTAMNVEAPEFCPS